MKQITTFLTLWALLSISSWSTAVEIDGIKIPEYLPADNARPSLHLNGAAKRKFLRFVDVYVGSLYVESTSSDAQKLLEDDRYRRMEFHMLRNVRGRKIADAFYEGMQLNVSTERAEAMEGQINQMVAMFDQRLNEGDIAVVEYIPGQGMHVVLAGEDRGLIPGKELFDAVLSIWIGEYPVSKEFKSTILGQSIAAVEQPKRPSRPD